MAESHVSVWVGRDAAPDGTVKEIIYSIGRVTACPLWTGLDSYRSRFSDIRHEARASNKMCAMKL